MTESNGNPTPSGRGEVGNESFLCSTGRHNWSSSVSAGRCCNPNWRRVLLMPLGEEDDPDWRTDEQGMVTLRTGARFVWQERK